MEILKDFENYLLEHYSNDGEKNTIKSYLSDIQQFIKYFSEQYGEDVTTFNHIEVSEYKNYMKNTKHYKFTTINRKIASLSIYDDFLVSVKKHANKVIRKDDFYKIERAFITADMLPKTEIKKVKIRAAKENIRDYAIFVLFAERRIKGFRACIFRT